MCSRWRADVTLRCFIFVQQQHGMKILAQRIPTMTEREADRHQRITYDN